MNATTQALKGPNLAEIHDTTVVKCPTSTAIGPAVDGKPKPGVRSGWSPAYQATDLPPAQEQPCQTLYSKQPASIVYGRYGAQLDWFEPDGQHQEHVNGDMPSAPPTPEGLIPLDFAVAVAGQNHLFVWYKNETATYGGAHGWQCQGGTWVMRDWCSWRGSAASTCAQVRVTGPLKPATGGPVNPTNAIRDRLGEFSGQVKGGRMGTSPADPAHQYSFLPSCFWMDGTDQAKTFELTIQDPTVDTLGLPDGRAVTYVYRINVGLQKVHWDYGDGSSRDGDVGRPWSAATPGACSNEHSYERVSATGNPGAVPCPAGYPHTSNDDGCYEVKATETFAMTVTAYWFDGAAPHAPVDMGSMAPLTLKPVSTFVRIQQIEGVPITH